MSAFEQAVGVISAESGSYPRSAYYFLREALNFSMEKAKEADSDEASEARQGQHVDARELCVGFRDFAIQEFGPMAWPVMREWGVEKSEDVGKMVFQLIGEGVLGRNENDAESDFDEVFELEPELKRPFLPREKLAVYLKSLQD